MDPCVDVRPLTELDRALVCFLSDHSTFPQFTGAAHGYLASCSRRFGAGLPHDIREEIVNECLCALLKRAPQTFDPHRGSAHAYLRFEIRHAARRVRAGYTLPGRMTRQSRIESGTAVVDAAATTLLVEEDPDRHAAKGSGSASCVHAGVIVRSLLGSADADVARTLEARFFHGASLREASTAVGVNAGVMSRKIAAFFAAQRRAA